VVVVVLITDFLISSSAAVACW
jgi:hypothetical protein